VELAESRTVIDKMPSQQIRPFQFRHWFALVYWVSTSRLKLITSCWNHTEGSWVETPDKATLFDTEAGAIVYRRGNAVRMQQAFEGVA
jgi:hypothetical protein